MTMKKRIFRSNTIMVLVSLLILFGIAGVSVLLFEEEFMKIIEENAELSEDTYEVQTLLLKHQKEATDWEKLSEELDVYGFHLYVTDGAGKKQFSNIFRSEWECIEELESATVQKDKVKIFSMENITIAKSEMTVQNMDYEVYASYYPGDHPFFGIDSGLFEMFLIVFVISGTIIILGLLLCCQIFTRIMIRKIMRPVDMLNMAAHRINEGNFEEKIFYEENDEFKEVCDTFNTMQENLREELEKNAAYEKARTEMISGISHDLRTPLTSVKGFIKGMLDGVANTPEKQQQYLRISYQKACDMETLLQKLFFFSKLETGNMPFFKQKVGLRAWMEKYVAEKETESRTNHYEILIEDSLANGVVQSDDLIEIDVDQMKRVFDNLIENSVKYAGCLELRITVVIEKEADFYQIRFCDNGIGMEEEKITHVFEQFYRGDESRTSSKDGSGLGLYVCRYIVEQHGGTICAANDEGFMVKIKLPIPKNID